MGLNSRHGNSIVTLIFSNAKIRSFPESLVIRPMVEGNEDSGYEIEVNSSEFLVNFDRHFFSFISMGRRHGWISELSLRSTLQYFV